MLNTEEHEIQKETKKCLNCLNYQRKIEELEQLLKGREDILTALQIQLKKYETNYKKLFHGYEQLRLENASALQDNFSLKKINAKLQEVIDANKPLRCNRALETETPSSASRNYNNLKESRKSSSVLMLLHKVVSIEHLVKSQNEILKGIIHNVARQNSCCDIEDIVHVPCKLEEDFKQIESGDHLDVHPKYQELLAEIERLKCLVDVHQAENERMKQVLKEKKILTLCVNTGTHTLDSVDDKTCDKIDNYNMDYRKKIEQLQREILEKEKQFEHCTCQLVEQLNDMHDNSQMLSDTLAIVTDENKSNVEIINKLKAELSRANQECEEKMGKMKIQINQLENELEENKIAENSLKQTIDSAEIEARDLKEKLTYLINENAKLRDCKCDAESEFKAKIMELGMEIEELKKELRERMLELAEYDEENRSFCQKMDVLTNYNNELINKIRELDDELLRREMDKNEVGTQMSWIDVRNLEEEVTNLEDEKKCLADKCDAHQREMKDKLFQLDNLKHSITIQLDELENVSSENEKLRNEIERIKRDNKDEIERLQKKLNQSYEQVEMLRKEHDEKTTQFECMTNELNTLRKSVTEDNDNFISQLKLFEKEKDDLKIKLKEHEKCKECKCNEGKEEIERLKAELLKKQCIIMELEKSIDTFNETMTNFDKTADELANENANLRNDKIRCEEEIEALKNKLNETMKQLDDTKESLEQVELECARACKRNSLLETGNEQLRTQYNLSLQNVKKTELEYEMMQEELKKLQANKHQIEKLYAENYQLQLELENMKESHNRRDSNVSTKLIALQNAYDELKNLSDQKRMENEKLREDLNKCTKSLEEARETCGCLSSENARLIEGSTKMTHEINDLKGECDKLRNHCAKKNVDVESLKETLTSANKEKCLCEKECQELTEKNVLYQKEILEMRKKIDELRRNDEQKLHELKKIKKHYESCAKQSQISREEYNNLRREYKEIKSMLSDQIKRYKQDTDGLQDTEPCDIVKSLKSQLLEKENQMMILQQNLKDASYEIIELKDYIHKIICDNNVLKSGINNLIGNLERKIKGPSFGSLPDFSAEMIAGEILQSLTTIEDKIIRNSSDVHKGCRGQNCDCMLQITSQYSFKDIQPVSRDSKAAKTIAFKNKTSFVEPTLETASKLESEINTTDSDDPQSAGLLYTNSLGFFKETIQDMKANMDYHTKKDKNCDCEKYLSDQFPTK